MSFLIIILSLIFSAIFSGLEIAFISANKFEIELESQKGSLGHRIVSYFSQFPSLFISTMLVGNNIALVIYGIYMSNVLEPLISKLTQNPSLILLTQTIISTLLILVTAEFLPKALFRINPNKTLSLFSIPILLFYIILYPIVILIRYISGFIFKNLLKVEFTDDKPIFGRIDLDNYLKDALSVKNDEEEVEHEIKIFQNALDFSNIKLRECIIPRTEIIAVEVNEDLEIIKNKFIESGKSKIIVFKDNIDNIIGYVDSFEMFNSPKSIEAIYKKIIIVPETMKANKLLEMFLQEKKSIVAVVDEFGGTSGIVSIEDVMEEIFGEIEDEHDEKNLLEVKINETEYIFSARLEIDYLNNKYGFNLPVGEEFETLGGMVIHFHENIPDFDEQIKLNNFLFTILEVTETKIEKLNFKVLQSE